MSIASTQVTMRFSSDTSSAGISSTSSSLAMRRLDGLDGVGIRLSSPDTKERELHTRC